MEPESLFPCSHIPPLHPILKMSHSVHILSFQHPLRSSSLSLCAQVFSFRQVFRQIFLFLMRSACPGNIIFLF
jgi:hypothetical protein